MFRQLKFYYVIISLPFAMLLAGSAIFIDGIMGTITRNPHPQINYAIFFIILAGGVFVLVNARRLVREAGTLVEFSGVIRGGTGATELQTLANRYTGDIASLLQMVAASGGRFISHQEQVAIEHELNNARARLNRRNALPQYLTGLLVGMGLLGTFIGLLSTLNDISVLISSFADLDMKNVDPILVFRTMIERMKAPMQSMGIAFSASMFGLLGSITLGLMMVGVRRLQGDIYSLLSSEIARHIENALAHEAVAPVSAGGRGSERGEEFKVLARIEERLAEAARVQQRAMTALAEDFHKQRAELQQSLDTQADANAGVRSELRELGRQLGEIGAALDKGGSRGAAQLAELNEHLAGDAREMQKLLALQVEGQKQLLTALDFCRMDERLAEVARVQQSILASQADDYQRQRGDLLRALAEQAEASNGLRAELQLLGRHFANVAHVMGRGDDELRTQVSELMIHLAADAKQTQGLLAMQVEEQARLRDLIAGQG